MKLMTIARWTAVAVGCILCVSCATTRSRTDSFFFSNPLLFQKPMYALLQRVQVVSDGLPLSGDYAIIDQSIGAIASRYGFVLSTMRSGQHYDVRFTIHEHSFTANLTTRYSVLAVLNVVSAAAPHATEARVVYTATSPVSIKSLYYLYGIGVDMFSHLRAGATEMIARQRRDKKNAPLAASGS